MIARSATNEALYSSSKVRGILLRKIAQGVAIGGLAALGTGAAITVVPATSAFNSLRKAQQSLSQFNRRTVDINLLIANYNEEQAEQDSKK